jgi:hypothetical protein
MVHMGMEDLEVVHQITDIAVMQQAAAVTQEEVLQIVIIFKVGAVVHISKALIIMKFQTQFQAVT